MSTPLLEEIDGVIGELKGIATRAVSEEEIPDVVGYLNVVRTQAQELSLNLRSEAATYATGNVYKLVSGDVTKRSYNLTGIIKARLDADPSFSVEGVLAEMVLAGVFGEIRWKQLQEWAKIFDVKLTAVHHEIEDGDTEADVGQHMVSRPQKIERIDPIKIERGI
jgi:hypothetical protein